MLKLAHITTMLLVALAALPIGRLLCLAVCDPSANRSGASADVTASGQSESHCHKPAATPAAPFQVSSAGACLTDADAARLRPWVRVGETTSKRIGVDAIATPSFAQDPHVIGVTSLPDSGRPLRNADRRTLLALRI